MNRSIQHAVPVTLATLLAAASVASAQESPVISIDPTLSFNVSQPAAAEPSSSAPAQPAAAIETSERSTAYGTAGSRWWTVGGSWANDFDNANDFSLFADWSQFITDNLEFAIEAAAWYFDQPGENTGGLSGSFLLRWHFAHANNYSWSIFADVGIGLLAAFDEVPDGGTGFDFLPRADIGATFDLDSTDGPDHGSRLLLGVGYQHISNARIQGDSNNPARDALCFYGAIVFPF